MHLDYLLLRMIRHRMPSAVMRFLLHRGWLVKPGIETREPLTAVADYKAALASHGQTLTNKRILLFGYGGNFALGVYSSKQAQSISFCATAMLHPTTRLIHPCYLNMKHISPLGNTVLPRPEFLTLLQADIRDFDIHDFGTDQSEPRAPRPAPCDLVFSRSVYEHLDDVEGITAALAGLTRPGGWHVHMIDLSDHFFKYPFEMLMYSEGTWQNWLNPTSNLNRMRYWDYEECSKNI